MKTIATIMGTAACLLLGVSMALLMLAQNMADFFGLLNLLLDIVKDAI